MQPDIDTLWNYSDPEATAKAFNALIAQHPDATPAWRLEVMTQIARTHSLRRQFDEAHAVLNEVDTALNEGASRVRVRALLERGRTFNTSGDKKRAKPLFIEAMTYAQSLNDDGLAVDAAHMVAIVEEGENALEWNLRALRMAEASQQAPGRKWLGSLYNNIGWTLHAQKRFEEALEMFQKALTLRQAQKQTKAIRIAQWSVARCLRSLGHIEDALERQLMLLAEYKAEGQTSGYTFEELGELYLHKENSEQATVWFAKAWQALSKDSWLLEHEPERLARLHRLGGEPS